MSREIRSLIRSFHDTRRAVPARLVIAINSFALPPIRGAMKREAPVLTGELVSSIIEIPAKRSLHPRGQVRVTARHGMAVQFGTSEMHANDFVDRALDGTAQRAIDAVVNTVMRII